jgi:uncharacterized protein
VVTADGKWTVVQQGMNGARKEARRYHWLSSTVKSFVDDPHTAIDGPPQGEIINLADYRARHNREQQLELVAQGPDAVVDMLRRDVLPRLVMPKHHDLREENIIPRRFHATLAAAAARAPRDFEELLLTPGVGARTVEALALVAEIIHGKASRFSDPARYSLAHGGKDGHPFPVPLDVFDKSIGVLRRAVEQAKLDNGDRLAALKRLHQESLRVEAYARGPALHPYVAGQRLASKSYGGRTVFDDGQPPKKTGPKKTRASPQLCFGGAWQQAVASPGLVHGKPVRHQPEQVQDDLQLSLFGSGTEVDRAAG